MQSKLNKLPKHMCVLHLLMPSCSGVQDRDPSHIDLAGPTVNTGGTSYIDHY